MKERKKRNSSRADKRAETESRQPKAAREEAMGYGDKKLDGPNRPSI